MKNLYWILALIATGLIVILVFVPPILELPARVLVMSAFSAVCHQIPERSLHVHGVPLAVCARCLGIYGGLLMGVAAFPLTFRWDRLLWKRAGIFMLIGLMIPGTDWIMGLLGVWDGTNMLRLATGGAFGLVAGYFLARAAGNLRPADQTTA